MILVASRGPSDWKDRLAEPDLHWKPQRSAMETALAWETARGLPPEIGAFFPGTRLLQAIVEYPVHLSGGGRPSFTDVFALLADDLGLVVLMVEAKRDETFGPILADWLRDASPGKQARLREIARALGLDVDDLDGSLRYQLLHRTASAVLTAQTYGASRAAMVVQSFSPEHKWFDDYSTFARTLGASDPQPDRLSAAPRCRTLPLSLGWAHAPFRSTDPIIDEVSS